jgi:hypothetical protein
MVTHTDFNGSNLRSFIHPVTEQVIISAEDYKQRKVVCSEMFEMFACETFKWKNQSWTKLSQDFFDNFVGDRFQKVTTELIIWK